MTIFRMLSKIQRNLTLSFLVTLSRRLLSSLRNFVNSQAIARLTGQGKRIEPIVVTFCTWNYQLLLNEWLSSLPTTVRSGNLVVFALDIRTFVYLRLQQVPAVLILSQPGKKALWVTRLRIFRELCDREVNFLHSDLDASWLRNPLPYLSRHSREDIVFSQATVHPLQCFQTWGFTLCAGFFFVNCGAGTRDFFHKAVQLSGTIRDDQGVMNLVLMDEGISWRFNGLPLKTGLYKGAELLHSRSPIIGETTSGLTVSVLPQNLFTRVPYLRETETLVFHPNLAIPTPGPPES